MLDPVRAHELYIKERTVKVATITQPYLETIDKMEKKIDKQRKENAKLKHKIHELENKLSKGEK
jgi:phage shock protein A